METDIWAAAGAVIIMAGAGVTITAGATIITKAFACVAIAQATGGAFSDGN